MRTVVWANKKEEKKKIDINYDDTYESLAYIFIIFDDALCLIISLPVKCDDDEKRMR